MLRVLLFLLLASGAGAQSLGGLARALPEGTQITDGWFSDPQLSLHLTQGVPFRVRLAQNPPRVILGFAAVDFTALTPGALATSRVTAVRFGRAEAGWSQMVLELSAPMVPRDVAMKVDDVTGQATLTLRLEPTTAESFAKAAGQPVPSQGADIARKPFTVILDPGHGGKDPGAQVDGLTEKDLVLSFARDLRDRLRREGAQVHLTRSDDRFISLSARTIQAHAQGGDAFVSIHADTVRQGQARGATVYTLSDVASDNTSKLLAARQNRDAVLLGADLSTADDEVTGVLIDLARRETGPRTKALAANIVQHMEAAGGPMNAHPLRAAGFQVLTSADIPSVLVELGFLNNAEDRRNIADPAWRARMAGAVAEALINWQVQDLERAELLRQ